MERQPNTEYVLSLSYGKDSIACIEAIYQLGLPLDRIVHAEVWATDTIPADLPPMAEFKKYADQVIRFRYGIEVEHIYATRERNSLTKNSSTQHDLTEKLTPPASMGFPVCEGNGVPQSLKHNHLMHTQKLTYESQFYHIPERVNPTSAIKGTPKGFPKTMGAWCKKLKLNCFHKAPLHKEQGKILCNTSVSLLTSLNALSDTVLVTM